MRPISIIGALSALALALLWWMSDGTSRSESVLPTASSGDARTPETEELRAPSVRVGVETQRVEPPPTPPAPHADDSAQEYSELRGRTAFENLERHGDRRLHVLVRSGASPLAGARVLLFPGEEFGVAWPEPTAPGAQEERADAFGAASFAVPAGEYLLRAIDGERSVDSGRVSFDPEQANRPVVLAFGRAAIHGTAHDDAGAPRIGVEVHAFGLGPEATRHYRARTDGAGRYGFEHLVAGTYGVHLRGSGEWSSDDERTVRLGVGDRAEVNFGWRERGVTWRGQLVAADGTLLPGRRPLRFVELERRDTLRTITAVDGSFERVLPTGRWALYEGTAELADPEDQPRLAPASSAAIPRPHEAPLAVVEVAANTSFLPVVVPGSVLRVRHSPEDGTAGTRPPDFPALAGSNLLAPAPEVLSDGLVLQWTRLAAGPWALSYHDSLLELDGRAAGVAVEIDVPANTTVEREVRFRWLR